jgi:hypothetical protein
MCLDLIRENNPGWGRVLFRAPGKKGNTTDNQKIGINDPENGTNV